MKLKTILTGLFVLSLSLFFCANVCPFPAEVEDISDRNYKKAVWSLIDQANESIAISQYCIKPGDHPKHPVNRFIEDLRQARKRKVAVSIYLNTKMSGISAEEITGQQWIRELQELGCQFFFVVPNVRLHDKLIIIDKLYVIEGSINWSVSALEDNRESAVIIRSPELAAVKLNRLRQLPLIATGKEDAAANEPKDGLFPQGIPVSIRVPQEFINHQGPRMVTDCDRRGMQLYLLVLFLNDGGDSGFRLNLEQAGVYLGMDKKYGRANIRRQIIKTLQRLARKYQLIMVKFSYSGDAWVTLRPPEGNSVVVSSSVITPLELKNLSYKEILARIIICNKK